MFLYRVRYIVNNAIPLLFDRIFGPVFENYFTFAYIKLVKSNGSNNSGKAILYLTENLSKPLQIINTPFYRFACTFVMQIHFIVNSTFKDSSSRVFHLLPTFHKIKILDVKVSKLCVWPKVSNFTRHFFYKDSNYIFSIFMAQNNRQK